MAENSWLVDLWLSGDRQGALAEGLNLEMFQEALADMNLTPTLQEELLAEFESEVL
ncbi:MULTISPECIES: hypothetical protein [Limosilactobacillus]|jgi:hypothetical protein|uniref:hypothetical protein n=1 Tax=Limosilactobacillus TaxID=2742598 RepID=UPI002264CC85|nr:MULTISPECIES: hypothetical protein [Limosilactobacillus]MCH3922903.1 hypothetical protein [Limosilactobacillus sp.]MCH3927586.1 hypothetical protein [Limosilactobacillus sp.]